MAKQKTWQNKKNWKLEVHLVTYISFKLIDNLQPQSINGTVIHQRLQNIIRANYRWWFHYLIFSWNAIKPKSIKYRKLQNLKSIQNRKAKKIDERKKLYTVVNNENSGGREREVAGMWQIETHNGRRRKIVVVIWWFCRRWVVRVWSGGGGNQNSGGGRSEEGDEEQMGFSPFFFFFSEIYFAKILNAELREIPS